MSIITFWNDGKEQSGKTLTAIAAATRLAIERNSKILLISTSLVDNTIKDCFWGQEQTNNLKLFNTKASNIAVENGMSGLFKLIISNKLTPSIITDYTRVIFKGRLEVISGFSSTDSLLKEAEKDESILKKIEESYINLIKTANQYYDLVIVDLEKSLNERIKSDILKLSHVNVFVFSQKMESINRYNKLRKNKEDVITNRCVPVIGKYIDKFKYNTKNIARYLGEKKEVDVLPFNLLYMEAAEEAGERLPDLCPAAGGHGQAAGCGGAHEEPQPQGSGQADQLHLQHDSPLWQEIRSHNIKNPPLLSKQSSDGLLLWISQTQVC